MEWIFFPLVMPRLNLGHQVTKAISSTPSILNLKIPYKDPNCVHVYHLYVIRTNKRDDLKDYLIKNGIQTLIHYPIPPHLQLAYKNLGFKKGDFPIAEDISETSLSLPLYPGLKKKDILYICNKISKFFS